MKFKAGHNWFNNTAAVYTQIKTQHNQYLLYFQLAGLYCIYSLFRSFGAKSSQKLVKQNSRSICFPLHLSTLELFPKSSYTKSIPYFAATSISFAFMCQYLTAYLQQFGLKVSINSGTLSEKLHAAIPISIISAPESTKYWHLWIKASFEKMEH